MSKKEKLLQKLASADKTFPWTDLITLLSQLGFEKFERAGSRVIFIDTETASHKLFIVNSESWSGSYQIE